MKIIPLKWNMQTLLVFENWEEIIHFNKGYIADINTQGVIHKSN